MPIDVCIFSYLFHICSNDWCFKFFISSFKNCVIWYFIRSSIEIALTFIDHLLLSIFKHLK